MTRTCWSLDEDELARRGTGSRGLRRVLSSVAGRFMMSECRTGRMHECIRPALLRSRARYYWTVIAPFMFIAACGVHVKLYVPAGTFANETT